MLDHENGGAQRGVVERVTGPVALGCVVMMSAVLGSGAYAQAEESPTVASDGASVVSVDSHDEPPLVQGVDTFVVVESDDNEFRPDENQLNLKDIVELYPDEFFRQATEIIYDCGYVTGRSNEKEYWHLVRKLCGIKGSDR